MIKSFIQEDRIALSVVANVNLFAFCCIIAPLLLPPAGDSMALNQVNAETERLQDIEFDRQHIWHPYTSMTQPLPNYFVKSASGVRLTLADGRQLLDGTCSWWSTIHGYNHPKINQAVKQQLDAMSHVMFGGITHQSAIDLSRRLIELTPPTMQKVFISDSGSVAVEVAMKMAVQYFSAQGLNKSRFLTVRRGYHGDTFATMSVCDPDTGMHHLFNDALTKQLFADAPTIKFDEPWNSQDIASLRQQLAQNHQQIAAVILEPIVQATGGLRFYHPQYLVELRALCDEFDVLLIFDEIATGFGRTGKMFACEHADVEPDIMCVGKAMTGGYMSLAATLTSTKVAETICQDGNVMMHGPTFMANPLACSAAVANLDLLVSYDWQAKIQQMQQQLFTELSACQSLEQVDDVRAFGAIGVVQTHQPVELAKIQRAFVEQGIWVRPFGKLIYIMPAYVMSEDDLSELTAGIYQVVKSL